jgi:hypothetical protein
LSSLIFGFVIGRPFGKSPPRFSHLDQFGFLIAIGDAPREGNAFCGVSSIVVR